MATSLRRVYENVRTGQAVWRDANRLRHIITVLARHGFGAFVQSLKLQDGWVAGKLVELAPQVDSLPFERRVLLATQELGPTFIKLGQMLSTRADLLPAALIAELQSLQDRVPPLAIDDVRTVIRAELGQDVELLFDDFDPMPLATASIAQVHTARLRDSGERVVVKVQRPNLEEQITADLEIMAFLARALEVNFPETRMFSPTGMVAEFEKAIRKEVDFRTEVDNLEQFRGNFAHDERVAFPRPSRELSTARVLTMEFVSGIKISEIQAPAYDAEAVVRTALNAVLQMIYTDGFFHGDLHPGNILVRDDGRICFLDFGLCGHLSPRERDVLTDLLICVVGSDWSGVARLFWGMVEHTRESTSDFRVFEADVTENAQRWFAGRTAASIEFSLILKDMIGLSLKHRVRMPARYTMVFKAVITIEGVGKQVCPELDLLSAAKPYVGRVIAERYEPRRLLEGGYAALRDLTELLRVLPDATRSVLDDLRAGRTRLSVEVPQLAEIERAHAATQHRGVLGISAATCLLCGTLALDYGEVTWVGAPLVSLLFFLAAGGLGLRYTAALRRH